MRKLTKLATTAIAAMALIAIAAPAANADRPFVVTDPGGEDSCAGQPGGVCIDTGYVGSFDIGSATCYTEFTVAFQANGAFETTNQPELDCENEPWNSHLQPCDTETIWHGQLRVPDSGPGQVDLQVCISQLGIWESTHYVTFNAFNNPRRWEQNGTATVIPSGCCPFEDAYFSDTYPDDNVKILLL